MLPGSMNIAPPPEIRRTTSMPCRAAPSGSTSLRTDWNEPMTTAGSSHSQMRSVGRRRPAATSRASTSSSAMCSTGRARGAGMTSKSWSCQPVALPSARRIAMPTDSGVKPTATRRRRARPSTAAASCSTPASTGMPVSAASMSPSASSGSRKKSPETLTSREPAVHHLEVDRHELAAGDLVLTAHATLNTAHPLRMPAAPYRGCQPVARPSPSRAATRPRTTAPWPRRSPRWPRAADQPVLLRGIRRPALPARGAASRGRGARIASPQSRARGRGRGRRCAGRTRRGNACLHAAGSDPPVGRVAVTPSERM